MAGTARQTGKASSRPSNTCSAERKRGRRRGAGHRGGAWDAGRGPTTMPAGDLFPPSSVSLRTVGGGDPDFSTVPASVCRFPRGTNSQAPPGNWKGTLGLNPRACSQGSAGRGGGQPYSQAGWGAAGCSSPPVVLQQPLRPAGPGGGSLGTSEERISVGEKMFRFP